jgi:hypothetical protein
MDQSPPAQPPQLTRAGFVVALLLFIVFAIVFMTGAGFMLIALHELFGLEPASGWSAVCALIGLGLEALGALGLTSVANALIPYTGLNALTVPVRRRGGHADYH